MVLKKRLDYGFSGYHQFPAIPRAPRSLRRRDSRKKSVEDSRICAFELLAAVAGKLLQESESSTSSNAAEGTKLNKYDIKQEQEECKTARSECIDQGSCIESVFLTEALQHNVKKTQSKESPRVESDSVLEHTPNIVGSDVSQKVACKQNDDNIENGAEIQLEPAVKHSGYSTVANNTCSSKDLTELCINTNMLINSDSSVQLPLYKDSVRNDSFAKHGNDVKIGTRDDDENLFGCKQLCTKRRAFRPQSHNGYHRTRKMLTSRYWGVAPKLKDCELSNTGRGLKGFYRNRKAIYTPEAPCKRRKLFDHSSAAIVYDQEASSESISNSPEKGAMEDKGHSAVILHRATGMTSSVIGHKMPFQSKDPHVKFSIKSFRVPELYIEVPETTTVGSLKRTVMEAVTAVLGGELHVGVLLQGKKVRDDNRTLLQTGISRSGDLDALGFSLEPSFAQASSPPPNKDPPFLLPSDSHQQLSRSPASPVLDSGVSNMTCDPPLLTKLDNHIVSKNESIPCPTDASKDGKDISVYKALVPVMAINAEALAIVPLNQKTKRSELSQRRTRRPFSVPEVEALVEAVEKLGTGRWRDVKMRAFSDANHRTYVDLKDKWKTLVHTASIAPQQRRGEPVPQELLDRVLAAHAYWSRHQSLQHGKHQTEPLKLCGEIGV